MTYTYLFEDSPFLVVHKDGAPSRRLYERQERNVIRDEAIAAGAARYFTGVPCLQGHVAERRTSNYQCVECHNEENLRRYSRNPERYLQDARKWQAKNPGYAKAWRKKNPEKVKKNTHNRRARKLSAGGNFTAENVANMIVNQYCACNGPLCGKPLWDGFHIDHKTPLSRGGSNWPANLQLLCAPCNQSKHAKTDEEWRALPKFQCA